MVVHSHGSDCELLFTQLLTAIDRFWAISAEIRASTFALHLTIMLYSIS